MTRRPLTLKGLFRVAPGVCEQDVWAQLETLSQHFLSRLSYICPLSLFYHLF